MKFFARITLVSSLVLAVAGAYADWSDAGWYVSTYGAEKNVFEVVNMNKMSCRVYAFNRSTGALKHICWNTSKVDEFYINGESEVLLTIGSKKAKLDIFACAESPHGNQPFGKGQSIVAYTRPNVDAFRAFARP